MRTTLLNKVGVRKLFTATFVCYGSVKADGYEYATVLLKDVKDHGTVCADHTWVKATPAFKELNARDKIMFYARVVLYPKNYVRMRWDVGLTNLTKVKRCVWK
jgi:hypothetical protein